LANLENFMFVGLKEHATVRFSKSPKSYNIQGSYYDSILSVLSHFV